MRMRMKTCTSPSYESRYCALYGSLEDEHSDSLTMTCLLQDTKRILAAVNSTRWKLGSYVLIFIVTGAPGLAQRSCELFLKYKSCDSEGFLLAHAVGASVRGLANAVVYGLQNRNNPLHRMLARRRPSCCKSRQNHHRYRAGRATDDDRTGNDTINDTLSPLLSPPSEAVSQVQSPRIDSMDGEGVEWDGDSESGSTFSGSGSGRHKPDPSR
jgi:hypothetical protein